MNEDIATATLVKKRRIRKKKISKKKVELEIKNREFDDWLRDFQIERMINDKVSQTLRIFRESLK